VKGPTQKSNKQIDIGIENPIILNTINDKRANGNQPRIDDSARQLT
jgi:hypothetical protein